MDNITNAIININQALDILYNIKKRHEKKGINKTIISTRNNTDELLETYLWSQISVNSSKSI